jgi:predicted PurR-regulated permease PerM
MLWPGNSSSPVVNGAAALTIVALAIVGLYGGRDLLIPLALAGIISFILFPLVRRLINWGVPQGLAVTFVVTVLIAVVLGGVTLAGHQVAQLVEEVPQHETNLREKARHVHLLLGGPGIWQRAIETLHNVEQEVHDPETESKPLKIEVAPNQPLSVFLEYTRSTLPSFATAGLSLVMTIFILLQYGELRDRVVRLMGVAEIGRSTQALNEAGYDLAHFLLLQTGLNVSFGVFIAAALWLIGIPSPGLWGALAALMRFVPYVGSALAAIFPIALAAMVDPGWWKLMETAAVFVGGDIIVGQFVEPLLFGSRTRLSSIAVVFGTAFWTLLWGPLGLILAVPLTLTIVVVGQHIPHFDFLRVLLGNEPVLEPHQKLYRQLLAGDTTEAAKDAGRWLEESGYIKYLDESAISCLQLASDDRQRGVLGKGQIEALKVVLPEYIAQVREFLDFKDEQESAKIRARMGERETASPSKTAAAVVIAGRGIIDHAAAELVADAIHSELGISTQCSSLGGLTGISSAGRTAQDAATDIIVLVSVGEVTGAQLDLLVNRAKRIFEGSAIAIGYWGGSNAAKSLKENDGGRIFAAETVDALVHAIGRIANERTTPRQPPPLKMV